MMVVLVFCCFLAAVLLDRYNRRSLVLGFGVASTIFLSLFVATGALARHVDGIKYLAFVGLMGYVACYG